MNTQDKFHFFIGNIFHDEEQINLLRKIQKKLRKKYMLQNPHWNTKFYTNMIYLGRITYDNACKIMEDSIKQLLIAITEKFEEFECKYTGFKIDYDKSFYKISLNFEDKYNYLENIIIPYLNGNIHNSNSNSKTYVKPTIDLLYYKSSPKLDEKREINTQIPDIPFKIDHISLIKGIPVKNRTGKPSIHDQMNLEEIVQYKFPLKQSYEHNNITINSPQQSIYNEPFHVVNTKENTMNYQNNM